MCSCGFTKGGSIQFPRKALKNPWNPIFQCFRTRMTSLPSHMGFRSLGAELNIEIEVSYRFSQGLYIPTAEHLIVLHSLSSYPTRTGEKTRVRPLVLPVCLYSGTTGSAHVLLNNVLHFGCVPILELNGQSYERMTKMNNTKHPYFSCYPLKSSLVNSDCCTLKWTKTDLSDGNWLWLINQAQLFFQHS